MKQLQNILSAEEYKKAEELLKIGAHYFTEEKKNILVAATLAVYPFYNDVKCPYSAQSLLICTLETAKLALEYVGLGSSAVFSILLYPAAKNKAISFKEIEHLSNKNTKNIIKGLLEIDELAPHAVFSKDFNTEVLNISEKSKRAKKFVISDQEYYSNQAENFRKLFLSLAEDMRVVLVLVAKQLYIMQNLKYLPENEKLAFSRESYYMYAPIAHQLGLYKAKTEFEELSMKYLESKMYQHIAQKLSETKKKRDEYIQSFITPIKQTLKQRGIIAEVKGRPKSIHSIWSKMKKQKVEFEGIYDLFAIRIIIDNPFLERSDEKSACWNVYSLITDVWTPSPKRLRDWISNSKTSGYESLHTTVLGHENQWVEVQIRTRRMDEIAEKGQAAHWKYKEIKGDTGESDWLNQIRTILENPEAQEIESEEKKELYGDNIFVFTPKGEIKKLRKGATVLDFAYTVHTRLGDTCTGAKINNVLEGLKYQLKNGDKIEIQTSKTQKPRKEWLSFVASPSTKGHIKRFLNNEIHRQSEEGKQILEAKLNELKDKNQGTELLSIDKILGILRHHFKIKSNAEMLTQLQQGSIAINEKLLYELLIEPEKQNIDNAISRLKDLAGRKSLKTEEDFLFIDDKLSGIEFHLAQCCNPIPGDAIFGFVTVNKGTKIHKMSCPNAHEMFERYGYRIVKAKWKENGTRQFNVKIKIIGENTLGVVSDITNLISKDKKLNMTSITVNSNSNNMFEGEIGVNILDTEHLKSLLESLKKIKGVVDAYRFENK